MFPKQEEIIRYVEEILKENLHCGNILLAELRLHKQRGIIKIFINSTLLTKSESIIPLFHAKPSQNE